MGRLKIETGDVVLFNKLDGNPIREFVVVLGEDTFLFSTGFIATKRGWVNQVEKEIRLRRGRILE